MELRKRTGISGENEGRSVEKIKRDQWRKWRKACGENEERSVEKNEEDQYRKWRG